MANKLQGKDFHFPDFGDAYKAIEAWWAYQDAEGMDRSLFSISAVGRDIHMCLSGKSLADQPAFIVFLLDRLIMENLAAQHPTVIRSSLD